MIRKGVGFSGHLDTWRPSKKHLNLTPGSRYIASCAKIELMQFIPRNVNTPVAQIVDDSSDDWNGMSSFNMDASHEVTILTARSSGRQFVLDPTAAQYGWRENMAPRELYTAHRVDFVAEILTCDPLPGGQPLSNPAGLLTSLAETCQDARYRYDLREASVALHIIKVLLPFVRDIGGLDKVVQLPQAEFNKQLSSLRVFMSRFMGEYRKSGFP
jgi:hypothetical protein